MDKPAAQTASTAAAQPEGGAAGVEAYRTCLTFAFFNALNWQVGLGTPMVLLAEELGATPFQVGLAWSFVLLLVPVQVLATPLLGRWGFKRAMLTGWGARAMFLLPPIGLALLGRFGREAPWMVWALIASVFCYALLRALGSGAWMPWIMAIIPERIRGRYFAMEQVLGGAASIGILLGSSVLFRLLPVFDAFIVQYTVAFIAAAISWQAVRRMPDAERPRMIGLGHVFKVTPRAILHGGAFSRFLLVCCVYAAVTGGVVPFCAYFLRNQLRLGADDILMFETMRNVGVVIGSLLLRNEIDRLGPRPFFLLALVLTGLVALFWVSLLVWGFQPSSYLPVVFFVLGMGGAAWVAASLSHLPTVTPVEDRSVVLAVHGAATSFVGGCATSGWGLLLRAEGVAGPTMNLEWFLVFFGVLLTGLAALLLTIRRLTFSRLPGEVRITAGTELLHPGRAFTYFVTLVDQSLTAGAPRGETGKPDGERAA